MNNRTIYTSIVILVLVATSIASCFVVPNKAYERNSQNVYDAIIVPGVPFENGLWSRTMKGRIYWAKFLYDKGITKNIIFSGSAVYTPFVEAKIMALYGEALGIDTTNIFTEENAEHSTENVYYSFRLARKLGFEKIAVATDPFQTVMVKSFANKLNLKIDYIPMVMDSLLTIPLNDPKIDPSSAAITDTSWKALPERESGFKRFKGTMGNNIDYTKQ